MEYPLGQLIKFVSKILAILSALGTLICAIDMAGDEGFLAFLLVVLIGAVATFLSWMLLYALGDIVENLNVIREELAQMRIERKRAAEPAQQKPAAAVQPKAPVTPVTAPKLSPNIQSMIYNPKE